jgi:uncharacterized protein
MKILRAADYRRMPWKNGGGETVEIAVFPEGAGLSDFDWRISMARVDGDGPFSEFPGIDRTLAILEGAGIILDVDGDIRRLTIDRAPHSFPADRPTSATLIDGTVTDFNVMSRRGKVAHEVRPFDGATKSGPHGIRLLFSTGPNLDAEIDGRRVTLGRRDALLLDPGETAELCGPAGAPGFLVTLTPKN